MVLDPVTRSILMDIFLVKRLETMIEIFTMVLQIACSFKGTGICPVFDDRHLCRPIETFLANYVWRMMIGVGSYAIAQYQCIQLGSEVCATESSSIKSIEQLCTDRLAVANVNTNDNNALLAMCQSLCQNMELSWHKASRVNYLQQQVTRHSEGIYRSQLLLSAHLWLYEEAMATQANFAIPTPIERMSVVLDLNKAFEALGRQKNDIKMRCDELIVLTNAIVQRLRWAVGANPGLQQLNQDFNEAIAFKAAAYEKAARLAKILEDYCKSILIYEGLRVPTTEALAEDQKFLNLVSRWEKSCMMAQSCSTVSKVEEALVELLDPEGPICLTWLNNVASLIDDMTDQVHDEINTIEKSIMSAQDDVHSCAIRLSMLLIGRHRIASDIRALLKSTIVYPALKEYFQKYKPTIELLSELHTNAMSKDFTEQMVINALQQIEGVLLPTIQCMYDNLFELENLLRDNDESDDRTLRLANIQHLQQQDTRSDSPSTLLARQKATKGK